MVASDFEDCVIAMDRAEGGRDNGPCPPVKWAAREESHEREAEATAVDAIPNSYYYFITKSLSAIQLARGSFLRRLAVLEDPIITPRVFDKIFDEVFDTTGDPIIPLRPILQPDDVEDIAMDTLAEQVLRPGGPRRVLLALIREFLDLDGDGKIKTAEIIRFAKAPLCQERSERDVPEEAATWKRQLWDEVMKETQAALLRGLSHNVTAAVHWKLSNMWGNHEGGGLLYRAGTPLTLKRELSGLHRHKRRHISREQFEQDCGTAGYNLTEKQLLRVYALVDSIGEPEPTVDTSLVLRYSPLDPGTSVNFSFPVTFAQFQELKAKDEIELVLYIPFLVLFTYVVSGGGFTGAYWVTESVNAIFLDESLAGSSLSGEYEERYFDISSLDDYWDWLNGTFFRTLWADGNPPSENRVQRFNALAGAIQIRQQRVSPKSSKFCSSQRSMFEKNADTCGYDTSSPEFTQRLQDMRSDQCYGDWWEGFNTETAAFSPFKDDGTNRTADLSTAPWNYDSCSRPLLDSYIGSMSQVLISGYDCSGYAFEIPLDTNATIVQNMFSDLRENDWIDQQTRVVIVTFFTLNTNLFLTSRFQYAVEFAAGGAVVPSQAVKAFRLFSWDMYPAIWYVVLFMYFAALGIFLVWAVRKNIRKVVARCRDNLNDGGIVLGYLIAFKQVLFENSWFAFDLLVFIFFILSTSFRIEYMRRGLTDTAVVCENAFAVQYDQMAGLTHLMFIFDGLNALFIYFRVFYYLRLHDEMNLLLGTLSAAASDVLLIAVMFSILMSAFGLCAFVVYGHVLRENRDYVSTFVSISRMLLGEYNYDEFLSARNGFTPFFIALFVVVCVLLLSNLVIAILTEAFSKAKEQNYDHEPFNAKVRQDPAVSLPPPSFAQSIATSSVFRDMRYWLSCFTSSHDQCAAQNPRIFWKQYRRVFKKLEQGSPAEIVKAALVLLPFEVITDNKRSICATSQHVLRDTLTTTVGLGTGGRFRVEPVVEYLERVLGSRSTIMAYEKLLVHIPAMQLGRTEGKKKAPYLL